MGKQITLCSSSLAFVEGHDDTSVASVMWFFRCVNNALKKLLTLILGSVSEVHMAMSSLVLISGYLFLAKSASNSCSCCEVKCVLCLLWRLSLTLFLLLLALMSFVSSS